jgi:hypothetical protein
MGAHCATSNFPYMGYTPYQAILAQVFAPFRPSKTAGNLQFEVVQLLSTVGVKMLIVDEIQHVLAGPMLRQRHFLNVIKYLGNELQIPIVAAGTHDAFNAIQTDPQLSNRFEPALLRRWTLTDEYGYFCPSPRKVPSLLTARAPRTGRRRRACSGRCAWGRAGRGNPGLSASRSRGWRERIRMSGAACADAPAAIRRERQLRR